MTSLTSDMLPDRKITAIDVKYDNNQIIITSDSDNINTSIAYHDIFNASQSIEKKNNLTYVNKGTTVIKLGIPYIWQGALISIAGLILAVIWIFMLKKRIGTQNNSNGMENN